MIENNGANKVSGNHKPSLTPLTMSTASWSVSMHPTWQQLSRTPAMPLMPARFGMIRNPCRFYTMTMKKWPMKP